MRWGVNIGAFSRNTLKNKYMYYEIKIKGGNGKEKLLTDCLLFAEAEQKGMEYIVGQYGEGDVTAIRRVKIMEEVNTQEEGCTSYKVSLTAAYDIDGKTKKMNYDVVVYAHTLDEANKIASEYRREGFDDMDITKVQEYGATRI